MAVRFAFVPARWLHPDSGLGPMDKLVLCVICQWTNRENLTAFPSIETIAIYAGIHRSTVKRSLKALARVGALRVRQRLTDDGSTNLSNVYTVVGFDPPAEKEGGRTQNPPRGSGNLPKGGSQGTPNVSTTNVTQKRGALGKPPRSAKSGEAGRLPPIYETDPPLCRWCEATVDDSSPRLRVVHQPGCAG